MKRFDQAAMSASKSKTEFDAKLLAALQAEEMQAVSYDTDATVTSHVEAMNRYFGKPYGDEVEGRSKITTREIQETISWLVPDLLDIFAAGGRICDVKAQTRAAAESNPEQRADYLNYVFFEDNEGVLLLYDFIFDSLLHKRAYADVDWNDQPNYTGWQKYENLTPLHIQELIASGDTELNDLEETQIQPSEAYPDGVAYSVKARRLVQPGCARIEIVAPEDMFIAGRSVDVAKARYKGRLLRWRRSEWKRNFPDFIEELDEVHGQDETTSVEGDERRQARFDDGLASFSEWGTAANKNAEELVGRKEYIWWSEDGEEEEKLYRVFRIGDLLLEVEEVDDDPFASAVAHRIPHRLHGLSMADLLGDLQKLKTILTRALVDGTIQANVPRVGADQNTVNLDDLLNLDYGAVIRTNGVPHDKLMPIAMPDLSASTLKALEWTNQIIEQRTGVSRNAQGLDPDSLNHTARGIQLLQNAANAVKRMIARLIACGVEEMITKLDRVIMRHQKQERDVELSGQWVKVNPASWHPAMKIKVSVGLGTGAKEAQLQFLQMIQADQVALVANYGPQNPSVTMQELYNTVSEKLRVMGYQSPEKFFKPPVNQDGSPWVPQPPVDPEQQKIQAKMQEDAQRLQMDQQRHGMEMWQRQQEDQRKQETALLLAGLKEWSAQQDAARKEREAMLEQDRQERQAQFEADLAVRQQAFEEGMAIRQQAFEERLAARQTEADVQIKKAKTNGNGADANFGGKPG